MARRHRRPAINLAGPLLKMMIAAFAAIFTLGSANIAEASKRVALVIGNSAYENAPALANPHNDATDIATALNDLGFKVVVGTDLDNRGMRDTVREFGKELRGADVAMLFYAGHALQVNGKNYLAPVDTRLEFENDLDFETIPLQFIQRQMEREAKTQLLFIDACRDNPLATALKEASRSTNTGNGLAEEKLASSGILIAFATDPDNVALDGTGRNSPFTKALLDNIKRPGIEISTLMTDVRIQVRKETDNRQTPWINSALLGRFYFNPGAKQQTDENKQVAALDTNSDASLEEGPSRGVDNARIQSLAWDAVKDSESIAELETFISLYGDGFYGKLAKIRLERLKAQNQPKQETKPDEEHQVANVETEEDPVEETREVEAPKVEMDPRELALGLQKELARLNCNPGRPDGIWGRRSQGALDSFAKNANVKLVASSPDEGLLEQLQGYDGKGCPNVVVKKKTAPPPQRQATAPAQVQTRSAAPQQQQVIQRQPQVIQQQQPQVIQQQPQVIQQQQQPQVIVQQPQHQGGVIVQQPGFHPQPQPVQRPNPIGQAIGGAIVGGIACIVTGC